MSNNVDALDKFLEEFLPRYGEHLNKYDAAGYLLFVGSHVYFKQYNTLYHGIVYKESAKQVQILGSFNASTPPEGVVAARPSVLKDERVATIQKNVHAFLQGELR